MFSKGSILPKVEENFTNTLSGKDNLCEDNVELF